MRARWWHAVALFLAFGLLLAWLAGRPSADDRPYDPRGTGEVGMGALVAVLERLGADVVIVDGAPPAEADTALAVGPGTDAAARSDATARWVRAGGTLVTGGPVPELVAVEAVGQSVFDLVGGVPFEPHCGSPAVAGVERVEAVVWTHLRGAAPEATGCFPVDEDPAMVVAPLDAGHVVVLGMPGILLNGQLDEADNAVLAVNLLAPRPGARVAVLQPPPPGTGDRGLVDLVPGRVWAALAQLGLAFAVLAWWRARRLGRPVVERLPTAIPGSELVAAVGDLLQRTGRRDGAAERLRADLRATLERALGAPRGTDLDTLVALAAERTGASPEELRSALAPRPLRNDAEVAALGQLVAVLRRSIAGADLDPTVRPRTGARP